jgi:putative hydrolase of the HAD superfamily
MRSEPDALLLDVGETLLRPAESYGATYREVFAGVGLELSVESHETGLRAAWQEVSARLPPGGNRYDGTLEGEAGFWLRFASRAWELAAGSPAKPALVAEAVSRLREHFASPAAWVVYPEVVDVLDALRARGVGLAVVSNWDSRLPGLLDRLGLASRFDHLAVSGLAGVEKPHPALFREALAALGMPAGAALHVGDVPELDWAGARLVDRRGRLDPGWGAMRDLGPLLSRRDERP